MLGHFSEKRATTPSATAPGYFNGIGSNERTWEIRTDTAFGTNRVLAQRVELARALRVTDVLGGVLRVNFGGADDTHTGVYVLQGPLISLGARFAAPTENFVLELGGRVIPPYPGPNDRDPRALALARDATITSGLADDAAWLSFDSTAGQIYVSVLSRMCVYGGVGAPLPDHAAGRKPCLFLPGIFYGGAASLFGSAAIPSWLGPQRGLVGNVFAELFVTVPRLAEIRGLQLGVHADASLSTIWDGDHPFPISLTGFIGWSPAHWLSVRVFSGTAGTPKGILTMPYGLRLQFYLP